MGDKSTWARDSRGLFNYKADDLHVTSFEVTRTAALVHHGDDVAMLGEHTPLPKGATPLLRLTLKNGSFVAERGSAKKPWLVVRDMPSHCHKLTVGDVLRLGRFKFHVHQLILSIDDPQPDLCLCNISSTINCEDLATSHLKMCRICLAEGSVQGNPFLSPCSCKGTIQYVHLNCLRRMFHSRLNISNIGSYVFKQQSCELCGEYFATHVQTAQGREPLLQAPPVSPPCIVLESMPRGTPGPAQHVISMADNKLLTVGRGHHADVRISDGSLSRCHAIIRFDEGHFVLEDNSSKFGTLVAMRPHQLHFDVASAMSVQVCQTVFSLSLQPSSYLGPGAEKPPWGEDDEYVGLP